MISLLFHSLLIHMQEKEEVGERIIEFYEL